MIKVHTCMHTQLIWSCPTFFATLWTITHQAPLSMGFSRQEYWKELPCPPPGGLPDPGIEPKSLMSPALAGRFFTTSPTLAQRLKRLPAMRETRVRFLGREDPIEKEMAIHSSTLAWKIPWTEEPDRLLAMGSQRVGHD